MNIKKLMSLSLAVFLITIAVFSVARCFGLVFCDDKFYVCYRPEIMNGLTFQGVRFAFTDTIQSIWMPLTYLSYMLDYTLDWGAGGMHVQSVLWHGACSVALFLLLVRLFPSADIVCMAATLLWSIHPLRVESVVWIASRKDVISTFFLLSALLAWVKGGKADYKWLVLSCFLVVIGACAKPSVMVFPAFALAIDFLITKDTKDRRIYAFVMVLSVVLAIEAARFQDAGGASAFSSLIPLGYRLLNAVASITIYLGNTIWPSGLAMQCMVKYPDMPRFSTLGGLALLVAVGWGIFAVVPRIRRYLVTRNVDAIFEGSRAQNGVLAGLSVFFACLIPFLGISGFGYHAFADRFTILPSLGLSLAATAALCDLPRKKTTYFTLIAVVVALALATRNQCLYWADDEKLMLHTLTIDGERNVPIQRSLGVHYWQTEHDMEKVYLHLKKSLDYSWCEAIREMNSVSAHFLMEACYATGRKNEAEDLYFWLQKINFREHAESRSQELLMCDVLYLLNGNQDDKIDKAREILAQIESNNPTGYLAANTAYLIAKETKDPRLIKSALERCAAVRSDTVYCSCPWAKKVMERTLGMSGQTATKPPHARKTADPTR